MVKEYSTRRNLNRGYMKLDVWHKSIELYKLVWGMINDVKIDFKLRSQIADAAQSVSANIAEEYSRRSVSEYMQHLYIGLGSLSETLTRAIALLEAHQITMEQFEELDSLHLRSRRQAVEPSWKSGTKEGGWFVGQQSL